MGLFRKYLKQFTTNKINIYCIEIYIIYACGQSLVKDWLCICVNMVWSWMKTTFDITAPQIQERHIKWLQFLQPQTGNDTKIPKKFVLKQLFGINPCICSCIISCIRSFDLEGEGGGGVGGIVITLQQREEHIVIYYKLS